VPCPPSTYRITGVSPSRHAAPRDFAGALQELLGIPEDPAFLRTVDENKQRVCTSCNTIVAVIGLVLLPIL
jgi:hypothetical protein